MAEGAGRGAARADTPLTFLSQQQGLGRNDSAPVFYVMTENVIVHNYRCSTPCGDAVHKANGTHDASFIMLAMLKL